MDAIAVFGKATVPPLFSPPTKTSSLTTTTRRSFRSLNFSPKSILRRDNLSAFPSKSHLFSKFSSSLRSNSLNNDSFIFLPHLVASMERVDQSYIMVKPDGVQRGLVGEIISRFEKKGFKLTGLKLFQCPKDLAEEHYKDLKGKSFFPTLIEYITSGPVVCMAWEGVGVVASARKLIGVTDPLLAEPGTIRGDLAIQKGRNVIHGSDSPESGEREVALWFKEGEVIEWEPAIAPWIRETPSVKA